MTNRQENMFNFIKTTSQLDFLTSETIKSKKRKKLNPSVDENIKIC